MTEDIQGDGRAACSCVEQINRDLAPDHTLNATMAFHGEPQRALVSLIRRDTYKPETRRSKPSFVIATFCPFCGEKYAPGADAPSGETP